MLHPLLHEMTKRAATKKESLYKNGGLLYN